MDNFTETTYDEPSFGELLQLCMDFGLVSGYEASVYGVSLKCVSETFTITVDEAEVLLKGLLLGYFFGQSGNDLSQAKWE